MSTAEFNALPAVRGFIMPSPHAAHATVPGLSWTSSSPPVADERQAIAQSSRRARVQHLASTRTACRLSTEPNPMSRRRPTQS